ncbi:MAG TPA: thioredoxin family protein [Candidatus Accumulibacter phosphatis]|nr:thiol reductase thioredoxin [Accumulibacter sp.]HRL76661.1 thioredoxin family protein [Candidatus Accumulibacter phosphatis]HRQ96608.1 thioredoxin family protein [Candidatus Accumulibacter phosphatis]
MPSSHTDASEPSRRDIDAIGGALLIEFGARWCGHCQALQAPLAQALTAYPAIRHLQIEDGPGRPLGRSFGVRLWPTLVFLHQGQEIARLVRPPAADTIEQALAALHLRSANPQCQDLA